MKTQITLLLALASMAGIAQEAAAPDSFDTVARELDSGGDLYVYWNPEELRKSLTSVVTNFWRVIQNSDDVDDEAAMTAQLAGRFYKSSGLADVGGLGASSVERDDGKVVTKVFAQRTGSTNGLIWRAWSPVEDKLAGVKLLPASTVYAVYGQYRLDAFWAWLHEMGKGTPIEQVLDEMREEAGRDGVNLDAIARSLDGDWGYAITLDPKLKIDAPFGVRVPAPGLVGIANVSDPILFETILNLMQEAGGGKAEIKVVDEGQLFIRREPDAPFPFAPTLHFSRGQILFGSTPELVMEMLANREAGATSVARSPEFRALADRRLVNANQMIYFSPRLSETISEVLRGLAKQQPEFEIAHDMLIGDGPALAYLTTVKAHGHGVSVHTTATKGGLRAKLMQYGGVNILPQFMMFGVRAAAPVQRVQPVPLPQIQPVPE